MKGQHELKTKVSDLDILAEREFCRFDEGNMIASGVKEWYAN